MDHCQGGKWIVRAASTGISGIIAPDGRYVQRTELDREAIVLGAIGMPPGSLFATLGPMAVIIVLAGLYIVIVVVGKRASR